MIKKEDLSIKAMRHMLGSIDLSDLEEKEESESDREAYCAAIFAVFPRLEKDIKKMLYEQLLYASNQAETWERVIFARGTFNGMDLLLEKWKQAALEHEVKPKEDREEFNKNSSISEI